MDRKKLIDQAILIRETEEKLFSLFGEGRLHGTIHSCVGQEFSAVCVSAHLISEDYVFSNHRGHGHFLASTGDLKGLIHELLGNFNGVCHGLGGSQHLHRGRFFSNGVQGNLAPIAAGAALDLKRRQSRSLAVLWIGDGTLGQGVLWETLNLASLWRLPLLIALEDNGYAQSTPSTDTFAGNLQQRVEGFGVAYSEGSVYDWPALFELSGKIVSGIRSGGGPHFLRIQTARLRPHSKGDDLRPPEEIEALWARDPLTQLMRDGGADVQAAKTQVEIALKVDGGARPSAVISPALRREWTEAPRVEGELNCRALIHQGLENIFDNDPDAMFIGEDIRDPYGGCFKVSRGLSSRFEGRILNTPISEAAMAGIGAGAALGGRFFVVEFMFGDFTALAFDQILNGATKLSGLTAASDRGIRVAYRAPMGGGRGYGPTHSQNLEKHFLGIPKLAVFALNEFVSPAVFYRHLHETAKGPSLVVENKNLYGRAIQNPDDFSDWSFQIDRRTLDVRILPPDSVANVVLLTYGDYGHEVWLAARRLREEFGVACACLMLTQLSSYSVELDSELFRHAEHVFIFEEGVGYAGLGAEVAAQLAKFGCDVERWAPPEELIPAAPELELDFRLTADAVIAEVFEVLE